MTIFRAGFLQKLGGFTPPEGWVWKRLVEPCSLFSFPSRFPDFQISEFTAKGWVKEGTKSLGKEISEIWKFENLEIWKFGNLEIWKNKHKRNSPQGYKHDKSLSMCALSAVEEKRPGNSRPRGSGVVILYVLCNGMVVVFEPPLRDSD